MNTLIEGYPSYGKEIEESPGIPMFDDFQVWDNQMFFKVYYAGGEGHIMIHVDQTTGEVNYLEVPELFGFSPDENIIYGIDISNDGRQRIIVLKSDS